MAAAVVARLPARLRELKMEGARSDPVCSRASRLGEWADEDEEAVGEAGRVEVSGDEGRERTAVGRREASLGESGYSLLLSEPFNTA